jgi:hypothetical protein
MIWPFVALAALLSPSAWLLIRLGMEALYDRKTRIPKA